MPKRIKYNPADRIADLAVVRMQDRIREIYAEAERDISRKLDKFMHKFREKDAKYRADVAAGKIAQADYDAWRRGQVFQGERWKAAKQEMTDQINRANRTAAGIINGERRVVFQQNANYAAYQIEKRTKGAVNFGLYDSATVTRLLKEDKKLLPEYKVNQRKDYKWNNSKVNNAVTQSIIQGESFEDLTKRLTHSLEAGNRSTMMTFARTAMTGAQNAGRIEAMHDAEDMGIKVQKRWIATLDSHTRDTHAELDGQVVDVDEPFEVDGMEIMYPGDPNADPSLVYNCRCTLGYEYPDVATGIGRRRDNETGEEIEGMTYKEWERSKIPDVEDEKPDHPLRWTREEYEEAKQNRDRVLEEDKAAAVQWYEDEQDKLIDSYGGPFIRQRINVKHDESLTEEEREAKLEEIDKKREQYNIERDKLAEQRDERIKRAYDKHDLTFEPEYEYTKIKDNYDARLNTTQVNPNWSYDNFEYSHNCQRCSVAFELRERGYDVEACGAPPEGGLGAEAQIKLMFSGAEEYEFKGYGHGNTLAARSKMQEWGDGSRAIAIIGRDGGMAGHAFNVEMIDGKFTIIDSQVGAIWDDEIAKGEVHGGSFEELGTYVLRLYRVDNVQLRIVPDDWVKRR